MSAHTRPPDRRTPRQNLAFAGAVLFGSAPLVAGFMRRAQSEDSTILWMAVIATLFTAGVLAAAIGQRRSKDTAKRQAYLIFAIATLLAVGLGYLLGVTPAAALWTTSAVMGLALAVASILVAYARRP
jgi:peptidoglycan/LPS O-acetylase OafA/YrhL